MRALLAALSLSLFTWAAPAHAGEPPTAAAIERDLSPEARARLEADWPVRPAAWAWRPGPAAWGAAGGLLLALGVGLARRRRHRR